VIHGLLFEYLQAIVFSPHGILSLSSSDGSGGEMWAQAPRTGENF